ncbi:hypothetical protein D915_006463 [Fasciola hepatica]|uniref:Uncharacterized protein n=1 Tax=Fasciola hepatica TaxID=6192 RepID=A0A4E0R3V6_FASHE|nr:hypothetical protein D915_006463 [Fasciola hepatica]
MNRRKIMTPSVHTRTHSFFILISGRLSVDLLHISVQHHLLDDHFHPISRPRLLSQGPSAHWRSPRIYASITDPVDLLPGIAVFCRIGHSPVDCISSSLLVKRTLMLFHPSTHTFPL